MSKYWEPYETVIGIPEQIDDSYSLMDGQWYLRNGKNYVCLKCGKKCMKDSKIKDRNMPDYLKEQDRINARQKRAQELASDKN